MKRLLFGLLLATRLAEAQDDDLEEAQGLPDDKPALEKDQGLRLPEGLSERSYLWLEAFSRKAARGEWDKVKGPNAEASLTLNYKNYSGFQAFLDGRALHNADPKDDLGILEQGGLRCQATEKILVTLGKERSRKAPGLIVAPSDFLYAQENLPGQREQRAGIWQGKIAWQESGRSFEVLALPFDRLNENGLPDDEAEWKGWAARGFYQFANFDIQLSVGHLEDDWHEGLSTQGIIGAWKVYAEGGWTEDQRSQLGGVEYQGVDKWSFRAEYYHQDPLVTRDELQKLWQLSRLLNVTVPVNAGNFRPFLRENYAIASMSGLGLDDRWNIFATFLRGVDDRGYLANVRGEWLVDDHQVLGLSLLGFSEGDRQQYALRPFDRQASLDWKFTL
ncbi:MAG TPA: hypothetical protein VFO10_06670 [Oligoflexus sp.]|uniref:hypothetical protein n=1 Tax=Oligoflexus sp. TaxID=1971216 RepID=UPI002D80F9DE|nr:hypothetical protein [Oligoflexus sp.]HET9236914.1 hypothetical protein [Oligoflexus sp.]